jgi:hypothetical protein
MKMSNRSVPVGRAAPARIPAKAPGRVSHHAAMSDSDSVIADSGDRLRKVVTNITRRPRIASSSRNRMQMRAKGGKVKKYAEGGKVAGSMAAIKQLAKKFQEALAQGDDDTANRVGRQLEALQPGSTKSLRGEDPRVTKGRSDKLATFAKGGKVSVVASKALIGKAKALIARAKKELGDDLDGGSETDLILDNMPEVRNVEHARSILDRLNQSNEE